MFPFLFLSSLLILSQAISLQDNENSTNDWGLFLSVSQKRDELPSYDIGHWAQQLHLQQCAFVEIGESFCALFVELRSISADPGRQMENSGVGEFFLGLCTCETLRSWNLCSSNLTNIRKSECTFAEAIATANTSARVHRRLCDVTLLASEAQVCNCTIPMAGQQLYKTEGFPTCFRNPLPDSICAPRGVCGVSRCTTITIKGIHSPKCDPDCHQRQPFCEEIGPWTSVPPGINSLWSDWSLPKCNSSCGVGMLMAIALCRNQVTGSPAIDCIGPGSFCCPSTETQCFCDVSVSGGVMKATRYTRTCTCTDGCEVNDVENVDQVFPMRKDVVDQDYDNADYLPNSLEEYLYASEYEETQRPVQRRLLGRYRNNYEDEHLNIKESNMNFMEDKQREQESSVNEEMADDTEDEEEDEEDEDEDDDQRSIRKIDSFTNFKRDERNTNKREIVPKASRLLVRSMDEDCEDNVDTTEQLQYVDYDSLETTEEPGEESDNDNDSGNEEDYELSSAKIPNLHSRAYKILLVISAIINYVM